MKLKQTNSDITEYGEKYHFYHNTENNTIVCTTLYKGQMVRGRAKCDPEDNFDIDVGKKLAYLRCRQKFMRKKLKHAHNVCYDVLNQMDEAQRNLAKAREFVNDSEEQFESAHKELIRFELELNK